MEKHKDLFVQWRQNLERGFLGLCLLAWGLFAPMHEAKIHDCFVSFMTLDKTRDSESPPSQLSSAQRSESDT